MILVTVGTTIPFDPLIEKIDELCSSGRLTEPAFCQIGNGEYEPQSCEWTRFLPNLDDHIENASVVIGHGGTGTTLELLVQGKKFVSVANPLAADAHQEKFLERLAREVEIIWTKNLDDLESLIQQAISLERRESSLPCLAPSLTEYINSQ